MNNFFTLRRVLAIVVLLVAVLLLYPIVFKKKEGKSPDQVNIKLDDAPVTLNVLLNKGHSPSTYVAQQDFLCLGNPDPITSELQPMLIKSIPTVRIVQDGPKKGQFAYDFEIIPEAAWDNGSLITANDVVFTLKLVLHPGLPGTYSTFFTELSSVDIDPANPKKFSIYFRKFYMLAVEVLCSTPIYPAYNYDPSNRLTNIPLSDFLDTSKTATLAADPNLKSFVDEFSQAKFDNDPNAISASGPYRLEVMNEQGAVMVKKQNWWGDKVSAQYPALAAYPQKLVYKVVKDDQTLENMIRNGDLDIIAGSINPAKFLEMKANDSLNSKFDFLTLGYPQYNRLVLNHRNVIFSDVQVRQAMSHLIDYDYLINQVQRGMAVRLTAPMPPNRPYYAKDIPLPDFNIAKAKEILAKDGWADTDGNGILDKEINGTRQQFTFKIMASMASKTNELTVNSLKESTRQAGIELIISNVDLSTMTADSRSGNYDAVIFGVALFPGSIEYYQRFHTKSLAPAGDNRAMYSSPKADQLIEAIRSEPDLAKRNALYLQIQELFAEELPEIPLYAPTQRLIISKKFMPGVASVNRPGHYEQFARINPE